MRRLTESLANRLPVWLSLAWPPTPIDEFRFLPFALVTLVRATSRLDIVLARRFKH